MAVFGHMKYVRNVCISFVILMATNRQKMSSSIASIAVSFWSSDTEIIFKYNSLFCLVTRDTSI